MIYKMFRDEKLSMLGFGTMRLPLQEDGNVDEAQVRKMTKYAMEHGVNYFDTAFPYHNGDSERVIGRVLKEYPRDSFYLATKYPGHQIFSDGHHPEKIFEEQLKKCGVEYFDFYLLHNVYEKSMETYLDPRWNIIEYFKEQKKRGRIRHLGFSSHAKVDCLKKFLDICGEDMEFCQIQLNYLDWSLQEAREKCELLFSRNIPIWVMEPVRGGKLASLEEADAARLKAIRPEDSVASWGFRFLQDIPGVTVVLSGMSDMEQMQDNIRTFSEEKPLSAEEKEVLFSIADGMKNMIPCTACRYCCDGCPKQLDIPSLLSTYNEMRTAPSFNAAMYIEGLDDEKRPSACIACGKCAKVCPQNIDIPAAMKDLTKRLKKMPNWAEECLKREKMAQRKI